MMMDGEWRVAFIANEHPDLQYGTAPMPVDDAKSDLYGSGYINGTIIGIPKSGEEPGRGLGARQVPDDDDQALARVLERDPQRPLDARRRRSRTELKPDRTSRRSSKIFANPKSTTTPITAAGAATSRCSQNFFAEVAGRQGDRPAGGLQKSTSRSTPS